MLNNVERFAVRLVPSRRAHGHGRQAATAGGAFHRACRALALTLCGYLAGLLSMTWLAP